jgi:serine protease
MSFFLIQLKVNTVHGGIMVQYFLIPLLFILVPEASMGFFCGLDEALPNNEDFTARLIVGTQKSGDLNIWSNPLQHQLTYCIDNGFKDLKPAMIEAMSIATQDWEKYANVKFTYEPLEDENCRTSQNTLFQVRMIPSKKVPYSAKAFFPDFPPKNRIVFFKKHFIEKSSVAHFIGVTRHELGHVLGFRHEHIHPDNAEANCTEDAAFKPITDYDNLSVMHYTLCGGLGDLQLSESDKYGANFIYPF